MSGEDRQNSEDQEVERCKDGAEALDHRSTLATDCSEGEEGPGVAVVSDGDTRSPQSKQGRSQSALAVGLAAAASGLAATKSGLARKLPMDRTESETKDSISTRVAPKILHECH